MRNLLRPTAGHFITDSFNPTDNVLNRKAMHTLVDTLNAPPTQTINTMEVILCKKFGTVRTQETNNGYPLKFREEAKNDIETDQTNQTLVQSDAFNTKITRYMGPVSSSMIDHDKGFNLYVENEDHEFSIILYKFKADIDINLTTHLKWVIFPSEPMDERVFIRYRTFCNTEIFRNIALTTQLHVGYRGVPLIIQQYQRIPFDLPQAEDRPSSDPNALQNP